jgi:hypothetical protein
MSATVSTATGPVAVTALGLTPDVETVRRVVKPPSVRDHDLVWPPAGQGGS